MKIARSLFHFFGGIHLAIALLTIAGASVMAGTLIESRTGSHLLAAKWTYAHPLFVLLLFLFFVNILFAALRRWPFQFKHTPFLITHLGLLMIIGGTIIKNLYGLQGELSIWEGSANQHVLIPHTHSLFIEERRDGREDENFSTHPRIHRIALDPFHPAIYSPFHAPQLKIKPIGFARHVKEKLESWIKDSKTSIAGFPSEPVHDWNPGQPFPEGKVYPYAINHATTLWTLSAVRTSQVQEAFLEAYLQELTLRIQKKGEKQAVLEVPLRQILQSPLPFANGMLSARFIKTEKSVPPAIHFTWGLNTEREMRFIVPLNGEGALCMKSILNDWVEPPFIVDLRRPHPLLCIIQEGGGKASLFTFDRYGRMPSETARSSQKETFFSFDEGFGGYGVQMECPIPSYSTSRESKERGEVYALKMQFRKALTDNPPLSPPLRLLEQTSQIVQVDFSDAFFQFLTDWNASGGFLYSIQRPFSSHPEHLLPHINWQVLPENEKNALLWAKLLFHQLEESWEQGEDLLKVLKKHHWPFADELKKTKASPDLPSLLNLLGEQIYSIAGSLPKLDFPASPSVQENGQLLSAYFRIYGIDYRSLFPHKEGEEEQFSHLENDWNEREKKSEPMWHTTRFETPLTLRVIPDKAPDKPEDERPGIVLEIQEGLKKETIALAYNAAGRGMKWPILNGKYALRFQPEEKELPYRLRLRQARQIHYPQSNQVYSYECDLLVSGGDSLPMEQTLSMNRVYETWDGHRFYLAGIATAPEDDLKRIQLAVNYDPAKYFLTYPGAALVFAGIILLFWVFPKGKKTKFE